MPGIQGETSTATRTEYEALACIEERLRIADRVIELIREADRTARYSDGTPSTAAWDAICRAAL